MNLRQISGMGDSNQSYSGSERLHQVRLQAFHFQCGRNYFVPQLWLGNRFRFFYFQAGTSKGNWISWATSDGSARPNPF